MHSRIKRDDIGGEPDQDQIQREINEDVSYVVDNDSEYEISASIVVTNEKIDDIDKVVNSYLPREKRILYIVDNSCREEYFKYYKSLNNPFVKHIKNEKNIGYGAAHNKAIRLAKSNNTKYHIVLNPDLYFEPHVINDLCNYADAHEKTVYMLPKVIYPNGDIQFLCKLCPTPIDAIGRRFLPEKIIEKRQIKYELRNSGYDRIMNPPILSGCFMFMRVSTLQQNNIEFDERFFVYYEDFDLIRRLHRVGWTLFYPKVTIVHKHARAGHRFNKMFFIMISSAIKYFNKYGWVIDKERQRWNKRMLEDVKKYQEAKNSSGGL